MLTKIKNKYYGFLAIIATQLFMLKSALAQSIGFAEPPASDMSRQFINQIFGGLLDGAGGAGGGRDAFGGAIATFNGAALVVGGILVAYTVLAGTLGTAHDGEMLGKKFSSVWVPIRTALGTALVMPVLPGGYCVMQGLVMWLIMQGVALGNMVWGSYTNNTSPSINVRVEQNTRDAIYKAAEDIYLAHVCLASKRAAAAANPGILNSIQITSNEYTVRRVGTGSDAKWNFGNFGRNTESNSSCGSISVPREIRPITNTFSTSTGATVDSLNNLENQYRSVDLSPIRNAHIQGMQDMINNLAPIAERAIDPNNTVTTLEIRSNADAYIRSLESQASSTASAASSMLNAANRQGWFLAGTWITRIILAKNKVSEAINSIPKYDIKVRPIDSASTTDVYRSSLSNGFRVLSSTRPELIRSVNTSAEFQTENPTSDKEASSQDVGPSGALGKFLSDMVTGIDLDTIKSETAHPLIVMTSIGDRIFTAILVGTVLSILAGIGFGLLPGDGGIITAINIYGVFAFPLAAFIGVAGMLSYILPNLPLLIWFGIIIGWTIMVVEAVLAAPLWAVMHLHPSGDDMTGKGGNGYMLVLGLLLRPALIVFGLISAIIFSDLFGQLLNKIFFEVFSSSFEGGLGFFGAIFGTAIYATLMFMIIKNTFALMHIIPDQLMRWIGGGGEQLGQYANQISDGTAMKAGAVAGAGIGYMAKDSLQGASSAMNNYKQLKATQEGARKQQEGNDAQRENSYTQADTSTGSGSGEISRSIDNIFPGNTLQAAQAKSDFANRSNLLGGANAESAMQYRQNLLEGLNQGMSYNDANVAAFSKAYETKYGSGAFTVADTIAKSDSNNGANAGMYNLALQRTTGMMNEKMAKIEASGESDPKSKMSEMFGKAIELNNQGTNMKSAIKQASSSPQRDLFNNDDNNGDKR